MPICCLCFGVEREKFDGSDKKYIICIDPMVNAFMNMGMAAGMGIVKKIRENPI